MNNSRIYINDHRQPLPNSLWSRFHLDAPLLGLIFTLSLVGMIILYSASHQSIPILTRQFLHLCLGFAILFFLAQIPPHQYYRFIPIIFAATFMLLVAVLIMGHIGKGAKRWFNLGLFHFQPSELMKLVIPMTVSWYLSNKPLPPSTKTLAISILLIGITGALIAKQPDLGTSIVVTTTGFFVLFLAGIRWRLILAFISSVILLSPILWHFMHGYQKARVLTLIDPERDPLGKGYHIIQSKIAIGSGGLFGKGWLAGSQSYLQFLPEHKTDFIFAVCSEEFGLLGNLLLLALLIGVGSRGLYISLQAKDTFSRLLAGSLSLTFFLSFIINIGMVAGVLPVVGVPLPLVSYGGSSIVITMASLGILMSIRGHRKLISG